MRRIVVSRIVLVVVRVDDDVALAQVQVNRPSVLVDEVELTLLQEPSSRDVRSELVESLCVQSTPRSPMTSRLGH